MSTYNFLFRLIVSFLFILSNFLCQKSEANILSSSDYPYYLATDETYKYIYPEEYASLIPDLMAANKLLQNKYQKEFAWKLDEKTSLVIGSSRNQIANAFAAVYPNNLTTFFNGGAEINDSFAFRSWALGLLTHETAHLYQINPKREISKLAKTIFRNNPVTLIPIPMPSMPLNFVPLPVVTTPNIVLPTWIIEGNAVFNESRFGNGGRLYSGEARALFMALLKSGKLSEKRITNNHIEFPFQAEKYIVGGYFSLFLGEKYGVEKTNNFFFDHAVHYFNPFRLSTSFEDHFGTNYGDLIQEFFEKYKNLSAKFQKQEGKLITKSLFLFPLNRQGSEIYFMANQDMRKKPTIYTVSGDEKHVHAEIHDIPTGKIFKLNNAFVSASSELVDRDRNRYSLWPIGWNRLEQFDNVFVTDIQGDEILGVDIRKSFVEPQIVRGKKDQNGLNFQNVGAVNSLPLFGAEKSGKKSVYAFIQRGTQRFLTRDGKDLFSYRGFYGKLCDVLIDRVFFIAGTESGSTVYEYSQTLNKISKVFNADNVVDCRFSDENHFILNTVTENGYEIIWAKKPFLASPAPPFAISYYFESSANFNWFDQVKTEAPKMVLNNSRPLILSEDKVSSYNSLLDTRFNAWSVSHNHDSKGALTNLQMTFSDPLNFNLIQFNGVWDGRTNKRNLFSIMYLNTKLRLNYGIRARYRDFDNHSLGLASKKKDDWRSDFILKTHLMRSGRWNLWSYGYTAVDQGDHTSMEYYLNFNLTMNRNFGLNFFPETFYDFRIEGLDENNGNSASSSVDAGWDIGSEWILNSSLIGSISNRSEITLASHLRETDPIVPSSISRLTLYGSRAGEKYSQVHGGMMLSKVLTPEWYSTWFPLGVRRLAPSLVYNYSKVWGDRGVDKDVYDYGGGADFEILAGHLAPVRFGIYYFKRQKMLEDTSVVFKFYSPI